MRYYGMIMFEEMVEKRLSGCPSISVELALPPTLNQSYKIVDIKGYSRLALSEEASEYKDEIAIVAFQALTKEFPVVNGPGGGEYRLELAQHLTANSRDVDANVKLVMDAICGGIGRNDNRVFEMVLKKRLNRRRRKQWLEARLYYLGRGIYKTSNSGR